MPYFFLHEILHITIGILSSYIIYRLYKNIKLSLLTILVSVGVDTDHLFDYFHYFGLKVHNPITGPDYFCLSGKLFIPLHGWEYLFILILLFLIFKKWRGIFIAIFLGLAGHYLLDQFSNSMSVLGYSFIFRLLNNFNIDKVSWGCL